MKHIRNKKLVIALSFLIMSIFIFGTFFLSGFIGEENRKPSDINNSLSVVTDSGIHQDATSIGALAETEAADSQIPKGDGLTAADIKSEKKDKYLTDPVPEGKPKPVEPQEIKINKKVEYHCTISIVCDTILDHLDQFNEAKLEVLPEDGVICPTTTVAFYEGESVFDVLLKVTKDKKVHMEYESTPIYNSNYIEGIHNIYEFDCGDLSGWMYQVNGWFPNYGCSRYQLEDGDVVEWVYTCDLGRDVGDHSLDE